MYRKLLFLFALVSLAVSQDFADCQKDVLVLLDSWSNLNAFSTFLAPLRERGFSVKFKLANDSSLTILRYGDYAYKNIVVLAPSIRLFGGKLDVKALVKFVEDGGNLLLTGDSSVGEATRELASEFGVDFDSTGARLVDHFNYDINDEGLHSRVCISPKNVIDSQVIIGSKITRPLLYEGIGMAVAPSNPLLTEVAWASETARSSQHTIGEATKLIVAFQAKNTNSRVVMVGSLKFLSDSFAQSPVENAITGEKAATSANGDVGQNLLKWMLHEQGVLRVKEVKHHRVGETSPPWEYTIKDKVHFSIEIEVRNRHGQWVPYDANDLQLTLIRIDPFIRVNMPHTGSRYSIDLVLPDVYGVFKFVVDYRHTGYSYLNSITQISIRPLKHTEYERFIVAAYPYYASAFSMLAGVFIFSFVYLYFMDRSSLIKKKKSE